MRAGLLLLALACLAAPAAHAAETVTMVNVGKGSSLQWPLYVGMAKGFFAQKGIELDDWGRKNKAKLVDFLTAVARSIDWLHDPANRKEAVDILVAASGAERGDIELTYDFFRRIKIYDRRGTIDGSAIGNVVSALKALGDLDGSAEVSRFMDPELSRLAGQVK